MKNFLVVCAFVIAVAGCDSSNVPEVPKKYYATAGSKFTYTKTAKTPEGAPIAGADTVVNAEVVEGVHSYDGMDSVITVVERGRDTTRMAYLPNGDVAVSTGFGLSALPIPGLFDSIPKWATLPMKTKGQMQLFSQDINLELNLGVATITIKKITSTAAFMTEEDITVGSEKLKSGKVQTDFNISYVLSILPLTQTYTASRTYWYSDKIGYFSKFDVQNQTIDLLPVDPGNYVQVLTSFSMKQ